MPTAIIPQQGFVTYRGDIAGVLDQYVTDPSQNIGLRIYPALGLPAESDIFYTRPKSQFGKNPDTNRAPGGARKRDATALEQRNYTTKGHSLEAQVPLEEQKKYAHAFDLKAMRSEDKLKEMLLAHEIAVANLVFNPSNYPLSGNTGGNLTDEWDDTENALPYNDVSRAIDGIEAEFGDVDPSQLTLVLPNRAIMRSLGMSKQLRERLGLRYNAGTQRAGELSLADIAEALGIGEVLYARAKYNSTPNAASPTLSPVVNPEYAFLGKLAKSQDMTELCVGRTIFWSEMDGSLISAEEYFEPQTTSDIIQLNGHYTIETIHKVGYLFGNVSTI